VPVGEGVSEGLAPGERDAVGEGEFEPVGLAGAVGGGEALGLAPRLRLGDGVEVTLAGVKEEDAPPLRN